MQSQSASRTQLNPAMPLTGSKKGTQAASDIPRIWGVSIGTWGLTLILVLAAFFHFYQLDNIGNGNLYYTAAVKSMLQSWHNFFFVVAEPGGSVTVDKPPLGLWIEAASVFVFGVNGFAVVLPNILAGLGSITVVYHLTRKYFGVWAGLLAALVTAVTPVAVAAQRNNTMDGLLTFTLVLTVWAFLKAAESGKLRHLLLGALLIGIGFNIKMMQVFLPVPALYAVYLLGTKVSWRQKIVHLGVATVLLTAVALSWAVAVDMTPAEERPYIGSSTNNTVMELIIGHNGLNRWFGPGAGSRADDGGQSGQPPIDDGQQPQPLNGDGRPPRPNNGELPPPPDGNGGQFAQPPAASGQAGRPANGMMPGGSNEVGDAGMLRFFTAPLSKEMSWLLPFAVVAAMLILFRQRLTWPLSPRHHFLLVWGGWLAVCWIFFSFAEFFHAYYLVMLAPPLGALVGAGVAELWALRRQNEMLAVALVLGTAVLTLLFQWYNASQFVTNAWLWSLPAAGLFLLGGGLLVLPVQENGRLAKIGFTLTILSLLILPAGWTYLTTTDMNNVNLPGAYAGVDEFAAPGQNNNRQANETLLAYLEANTQDTTYLMAVPSSMQGAAYVLETGRPVLYMGGFGGGDPVVNADDIVQMVADGELRYVMLGGGRGGQQQGVSTWVQVNCTAVPAFASSANSAPGLPAGPGGAVELYQCEQ